MRRVRSFYFPGATLACVSPETGRDSGAQQEKGLINSRVGSPVQSVRAQPRGPRFRLPGPGGAAPRGGACGAPRRSAPAAPGARWLLIRAQAGLPESAEAAEPSREGHCALRG